MTHSPPHRLGSYETSALLVLLVASMAGSLMLLPVPSRAFGEACTAEVPLSTHDTSTADVAVVPGRSIGPLAIGMTEPQVGRRATRIVRRSRSGSRLQRWRTPAAEVDVMFGRHGRVRFLRAYSKRLTIAGIHVAQGADAIGTHLANYNRANCRDEVEFQSPIANGRSTALVLGTGSPSRVTLVIIRDLRAALSAFRS